MSLRKESEKIVKITINVYEVDWEWFREHYLKTGASKAARTVLRNHRLETAKKIAARKNEIDAEIEL